MTEHINAGRLKAFSKMTMEIPDKPAAPQGATAGRASAAPAAKDSSNAGKRQVDSELIETFLSIRDKATRKERLQSLRALFSKAIFICADDVVNMAKQVNSLVAL
jgi:hypothetical protein